VVFVSEEELEKLEERVKRGLLARFCRLVGGVLSENGCEVVTKEGSMRAWMEPYWVFNFEIKSEKAPEPEFVREIEEGCRREGGRFRRGDGYVVCEFDKVTARVHYPRREGGKWVSRVELEFK